MLNDEMCKKIKQRCEKCNQMKDCPLWAKVRKLMSYIDDIGMDSFRIQFYTNKLPSSISELIFQLEVINSFFNL